MNPFVLAGFGIACLLVLLLLRVNVGIALGITGFLGLWLKSGQFDMAAGLLTTTPYATVANFGLLIVPLFILMGSFAGEAGLAEGAYLAAQTWFARMPGGLAIATTVANTAFGAACGSSIAASAVFTKFSMPEMKRHGYQPAFAGAAIAAAGLLAMLIPPSSLMIIYGILAQMSIGKLFVAGVIPGLLLTAIYVVGIIVLVKRNPALIGNRPMISPTWGERFASLRGVWGIPVLAAIVLGGIYMGVFSPTEAGAAGAMAAFIIGLIVRKLNRRTVWQALLQAGQTTATIFLILIGAMIYSKFLVMSGAIGQFVDLVKSISPPPLVVLAAFIVMYLILGCLLDSLSMLTITLPVVLPISAAFGWDPIWLAMVVIMTVEIGLVTPPLGLTIYTVKAVAGDEVTLEALFRAVMPFFLMMMITLAALVAFPSLSTYLPALMSGK